MEPLVSVIIPAFDDESTVVRAIQSVLDQTYSRVELIVVDDGSSDSTWAQIQSCREAAARNFAAYTTSNGGVSSAIN